jgi:hypothetical protein
MALQLISLIYTFLLGVLCASFVEVAIYAFYPSPEREWEYNPQREKTEEEIERDRQRRKEEKRLFEIHSTKHYVLSLVGAMIQAIIAMRSSSLPHVLADGILLGSVFTLTTGTWFGIQGGGRLAKLSVVTVSLVLALVLGWIEFGTTKG